MSIKYDSVVPWGRNFNEYCAMFSLTADDLRKKILGCGDGPASFNFTCNMNGGNVISVDPIYSLTKQQIHERINSTYKDVLTQTRENRQKFKWDVIKTVDELGDIRMKAMTEFLSDYETGKQKGKYIAESLPALSFADNSFDISLSSHFLFLHSDNLTYEFHRKAILEMLRVSTEVRIFPFLDVNAKRSIYVDQIMNDLKEFQIAIKKVQYEFQIGGNEMLVIKKYM